MVINLHRYSISGRNMLIDSEPTARGEAPLVWVAEKREWVEMNMSFGEHVNSLPVTDEEARRFMETGEISAVINRRIHMDFSDDSQDLAFE